MWDELDWNRLRDLNVRDILELRRRTLAEAEAAECIECPQFVRHVGPFPGVYTSIS